MTTPAPGAPAPLACDLAALDPRERQRHAELWRRVRATAPAPAPAERGVAFHLPPTRELAGALLELAMLERRCCPFLRIGVAFEPDGGPLKLELGGDEHVRAFLAGVFPGASGGAGWTA